MVIIRRLVIAVRVPAIIEIVVTAIGRAIAGAVTLIVIVAAVVISASVIGV